VIKKRKEGNGMEELTWNYTDNRQYLEKVRKGMPPLIISVAITGGGHGKEVNLNLPETPEEQANQTYEAYKAGASVVHVHARQPDNLSLASSDPKRYREVNSLIREKCSDIIIGNTTGGGPGMTIEQRTALLDIRPEVCSLSLSPIAARVTFKARKPPLTGRPQDIFIDDVVPLGSWKISEDIAKVALERDVKPELEIFNPGDFWQIDNLTTKGLLKKPYFIQFVMGFVSSFFGTPKNLISYMEQLPPDSIVNVAGIGTHQLPMNVLSIIMGTHVRTGLEDNIYYRRRELCTGNAQLVERIARFARDLGREIATPKQARQMLGISEKPRQY